MKKSALLIGFFLLLLPAAVLTEVGIPTSAQAQTVPSCSAEGYTVVFVNGVFDTRKEAIADSAALTAKLGDSYNSEPVTVQLGYNPSHLAGAGDILQSTAQLFSRSVSNFDLDTILMEIYPEVQTRKLVLVGHSQGAFYTNDMYDYLLAHGEPKDALNVYNVASPASYTAGNGTYLNSSGDSLLNFIRTVKPDILPNNIDLSTADTDATFPGHNFVADYLAQGGSRMQQDINGEMSLLGSDDASSRGDCFTPPTQTFGYDTEAVAFAVADPAAVVVKTGTVATIAASEVALNSLSKVAAGALQMFADTVTVTTSPPTELKQQQTGEKIINKLYGSSIDSLSPQDKKDLLGTNQGGAVILANPPKAATVSGIVLGTSTEATATAAIATPQFPPVDPNFFNWIPGGGGGAVPTMPSDVVVDDTAADSTPPTADPDTPAQTNVTNLDNPPAVINEIEWAGDMFDGGREWVELKNRTSNSIDLSSYVLYAKDGGSQYIPLVGTLPAHGFFVVERDAGAPLGSDVAQVYAFDRLDDAGEQLALAQVTEDGTTTIDMTPPISACSGWCAGSGVNDQNDGETLSMERISADASGIAPDNWASNDTYTVTANMPTPDAQPWRANGLPLYATPLLENSLHQPDTGFYCNPDTSSITPGQTYTPQTGQCTVLDKNIPFPGPFSAGVFKGSVGSSTEVGFTPGLFHTGKVINIPVDFSDAQPGDQYFVAMWKPYFDGSLGGVGVCTNPNDDTRIPSYLTTGHWLGRDSFCGDFTADRTDTPDTPFVLIPFTRGGN